jgi:hypothetical protein
VVQIKVEIILPLYYNDKRDIEDKKFEETHDDIKKQFTGFTIGDRPLLGYWIDPDTGISYENEKNTLYWVLCDKTKNNIQFFKKLKERLKQRFEQESILIYYVNVYRI